MLNWNHILHIDFIFDVLFIYVSVKKISQLHKFGCCIMIISCIRILDLFNFQVTPAPIQLFLYVKNCPAWLLFDDFLIAWVFSLLSELWKSQKKKTVVPIPERRIQFSISSNTAISRSKYSTKLKIWEHSIYQ
mgnify:CR=1 FL=1